MEEIWKPVKDFEDYYEISNLGRLKRLPDKLICENRRHGEYKYITLRVKNHTSRSTSVHRLVAETFLGIPKEPNLQVNHINEIKSDNRVTNLEWVTPSENISHGTRIDRFKKSKYRPVKATSIDGTVVKYCESATLAYLDGFSKGEISSCCTGRKLQHKGFRWEFV